MSKPTGFSPFAALRCPQAAKLSPLDKLLLSYLSWRQGANAWAWPSLERIASDLGLEKRVVVRSTKRLAGLDIVEKEAGRAGRGHVNRYRVATPEMGDRQSPFQPSTKGDIQYTKKGTSRRAKGDCAPPEHKRTTRTPVTARAREDFGPVWSLYPKHVGKTEALAAWQELSPSPELVAQILASIAEHVQSERWSRSLAEDGGRFIPKLATFLLRRQWEDEPAAPPQSDGCKDLDPETAAEMIALAFAVEDGQP